MNQKKERKMIKIEEDFEAKKRAEKLLYKFKQLEKEKTLYTKKLKNNIIVSCSSEELLNDYEKYIKHN